MSDFTKTKEGLKVSSYEIKNSFVGVSVDVEEGSGSEEKIVKKFEDPSCCTATECCRSSSFCEKSCKTSVWCAYCIGFRKLSWATKGLIFLFLSVSAKTLEFAADTSFCYYTPVVPMKIIPMSTARGQCRLSNMSY